MARLNVELKARDPDPEASVARCLALGAADGGLLIQRDTYFAGARGRLKLREQDASGAELIAYSRPDAPQASESSYVLAPVGDGPSVAEALEAALGAAIVVVAKRRRLFLWEGVRIHLDEVDGLGAFVELEAVVGPGACSSAAQAHEQIARVREALAIDDGALVAAGYSDLLRDGPQDLLRAADAAMRRAYAPYSKFRVGAALRGTTGAIYAGPNVENASYPQGQCAETSALGALVAAGETAITAVAVVSDRVVECPPCGGCRQRLAEFGSPETPVHLGRPGAPPRTVTLAELLPMSFGRGDLGA